MMPYTKSYSNVLLFFISSINLGDSGYNPFDDFNTSSAPSQQEQTNGSSQQHQQGLNRFQLII